MPEETVVLPVRMTQQDLERLRAEAKQHNLDVSVFTRHKLAEIVPGFTGNVNKQGGARRNAGRKPKEPKDERQQKVG